MPISEAKKRADLAYARRTYDQFKVSIRRDAEINGDEIRAHVRATRESLNAFLTRAIMETITNDRKRLPISY